jgi:hypothetical protein
MRLSESQGYRFQQLGQSARGVRLVFLPIVEKRRAAYDPALHMNIKSMRDTRTGDLAYKAKRNRLRYL